MTVYVLADGDTRRVEHVDPAWLQPDSGVTVWVDLVRPTPEDGQAILANLFHFHPLSIEDALSDVHHPKVEPYDGYLYVILHGIDFHASQHEFSTRDVDFFLGPNYLVTVHDGESRSIARVSDVCGQHAHVLREGPVALLHRIVDAMIDHYAPEVEKLEAQIDEVEDRAILGVADNLMPPLIAIKRDLSSLRRVLIPQRDVVGRLARREFPQVSAEMAYRFRDVYDQLVRMSDETTMFHDRVTGIVERDRKSTRLNSSHVALSRMPSSA